MFTRCLSAAAAAVLMVPATAAADPVTLGAQSTAKRDSVRLTASLASGDSVSVGAGLPAASSMLLSLSGFTSSNNFMMELMAYGARSSWTTLRTDVLDSFSFGSTNGRGASTSFSAGTGFTTSAAQSGFAVGEPSGLTVAWQPPGVQRGALYAGGPTVTSEEIANATNVLSFTAVIWASSPLQVTFGFRDAVGGGRSFLALASAHNDVSPTPEPASMLLIGTGLAGLAALRRRQRARR